MSVSRCLILLLFVASQPLQAGVTVKDDTGRTVSLAAPAQRIVSLAPHVTEQLYAVGAGTQLVGVVDYSDYPEAAKSLPRVGGYSRLDLEAIIALRPDLVVGWQSGNSVHQLEQLQELGINVYRSEPRELNDIAESLQRLGVLSGHRREGEEQAVHFRQTLRRLARGNHDQAPVRIFYQIWDQPLMTVNGEHLISDVIELCGGENVFANLGTLTPTVSKEAVIAADPAMIVASGMADERPEWLEGWRRWQQLAAVRNDELHFIPPDLMQRATPRLLLGAEMLCGMVRRARLP